MVKTFLVAAVVAVVSIGFEALHKSGGGRRGRLALVKVMTEQDGA